MKAINKTFNDVISSIISIVYGSCAIHVYQASLLLGRSAGIVSVCYLTFCPLTYWMTLWFTNISVSARLCVSCYIRQPNRHETLIQYWLNVGLEPTATCVPTFSQHCTPTPGGFSLLKSSSPTESDSYSHILSQPKLF